LITAYGRQSAIRLHKPGVIVEPRLPWCGTAATLEASDELEPRVQRAARHPMRACRATEHASGNNRHVFSAQCTEAPLQRPRRLDEAAPVSGYRLRRVMAAPHCGDKLIDEPNIIGEAKRASPVHDSAYFRR
jgi:hypothetical protein